jgi:hypothetical protein
MFTTTTPLLYITVLEGTVGGYEVADVAERDFHPALTAVGGGCFDSDSDQLHHGETLSLPVTSLRHVLSPECIERADSTALACGAPRGPETETHICRYSQYYSDSY